MFDVNLVGYYVWVIDMLLILFVLGELLSFEFVVVGLGKVGFVMENFGCSLVCIFGILVMFFVLKDFESEWMFMSFDLLLGIVRNLVVMFEGSEDFVWLFYGVVWMGVGLKLFMW